MSKIVEIMENISEDMGILPKDVEWDEILDKISNWSDMEIDIFWSLTADFGFEECYDIVDNEYYTIWSDCDNMGDVAEKYLYDCGYLDNLPDVVINNINYDDIGYDMELEGNYIICDDYVIEVTY